jgi:penicillin-binding protein 1C
MAKRRRLIARPRQRSNRLWLWLALAAAGLASLGAALVAVVVATGVGIAIAVNVASTFLMDLPPVDQIATVGGQLFQTTTIHDRKGRPLGELLGEGRRRVVAPEDIPQVVKIAVVAAEDATFYDNPGVEVRAILRAVWNNWRGGEVVSGASTITQQLVKNALLSPEETYERKIREAVLAWQISQRFSKDEILGLYLNQNHYGGLAYGVAAAARTYFDKDLTDVTLAEAAMLVGLLPAPSLHNPHVDPQAARREQLRVLAAIARHELAPAGAVAAARDEDVRIAPPLETTSPAPHFLDYVVRDLQERYGPEISRQGWEVTTTLDLDLQAAADTAVREHVATLSDREVTNGALLAIRPSTGEILAMVGSLDFNDEAIDGQVNVTTSLRQPGSAFKLFTYASALEQGYNPATMLLDIPTTVPIAGQEPYRPRNYDRRFRGPVSLRTALGSSLNIPAVRTQLHAGLDATLDLADRLGITSLTDRSRIGPALSLGSNEVQLLELTGAYATVANGGRRVKPAVVLCIRDARGLVVEQLGDGCSLGSETSAFGLGRVPLSERVVAPEIAYLMTSILSDRAARAPGFGQVRELLDLADRPAAVKTGTTENTRDALTVGFTPQLATGVWVGNADGTPMDDVTGVRGAGPIWQRFMDHAHAGLEIVDWPRPATVMEQEVDAVSGLLPSPFTPETRMEEFATGTVPTQRDVVHQPFRIHVPTGLLATPSSPPEDVEEQVFVVLPTEAATWQREQDEDSPYRLPPETFAGGAASPVATAQGLGAQIASPAEGQAVRTIMEIFGTATIGGFAGSELHYGVGPAPGDWTRIGNPADAPRVDEQLGAVDTIQLPDGIYTLRLTVRAADGGAEVALRRFVVDNTPPVVEVVGLGPEAGAVAGTVPLGAVVEDAGGVAGVEFRVDGKPVGTARFAPYQAIWTSEPGEHEVVAIATDRAGNSTVSEPVTFRAG